MTLTTSEKNDMSQLVRIQDDESHTLMVTLAGGAVGHSRPKLGLDPKARSSPVGPSQSLDEIHCHPQVFFPDFFRTFLRSTFPVIMHPTQKGQNRDQVCAVLWHKAVMRFRNFLIVRNYRPAALCRPTPPSALPNCEA